MNKHLSALTCVFLAALGVGTSQPAWGDAVKWDYLRHPVTVTENRPAADATIGLCVASAFDGYGTQGAKPACVRAWHQAALPTASNPLACEIDYGSPTLVTAFVHYFYVPDSRDLRFTAPGPSAFKKVRLSARNEPSGPWKEIATLADLAGECPQVLPTGTKQPWRYWRLEVLELAPGAEFLCTYELETYTGGIPKIAADRCTEPDPAIEFANSVRRKTAAGFRPARITLATADRETLHVQAEGVADLPSGELHLMLDGKPAAFAAAGAGRWQIDAAPGQILLEAEPTALGLLLKLRYSTPKEAPIKYRCVSLRLSAPQTRLYYIPAYAWSRSPVETMVSMCHVQTRMAVLGFQGGTLCLVPGTDRGTLGFAGGAAQNDLLLGPQPTPLLLAALPGDWWNAYRFAVDEVYGFCEPRQTVPVSEMQYGVSRYLMSNDVWEPTLGTVRSWPANDLEMAAAGYVDAFNFYGVPYSIPSYWARYVMSDDPLARQRCGSIARWLCRSGVRVAAGPARGAFFSNQRFPAGEPIKLDKQGCTQASTTILTTQATGAAVWSLLFYRHVSGENDAEINRTIEEGAAWLLHTQTPEGGWPYGHTLDGKPAAGAPSGGSVWNIRTLWRLGKESGDRKYLDAANRGRQWYLKTFVEPHHYHGYWEDMGPDTREGYDAAVAAVTFAEMGDKQATVACGRDAVQWVFTRRIEPREATCSAGLVSEQYGWPPAAYCNPMMALAAYSAWQQSGDDSWRPFAMIPKATGWWYQPDSGAMVWIVDATQMAPMVGPTFDSYWGDWCIAQSDALMLRWLVREMNRRLGDCPSFRVNENGTVPFAAKGTAAVLDEETLRGKLLGEEVQAWSPPGGLRPILPQHGQVNWLGLRSNRGVHVVLMNFADDAPVRCELTSRALHGASIEPETVRIIAKGRASSQPWDGKASITLPRDGAAVLDWKVCP
jgi:hypothetical protein